MLGTTYVAYSEDGHLIGYYTIASSSILRAELQDAQHPSGPKYPAIPALLLARLAVQKKFSRKGNGEQLLRHALTTALEISSHSGIRYVIVDAYADKVQWYEKYGFQVIERSDASKMRKMYIDLAVVRMAVAKGCKA